MCRKAGFICESFIVQEITSIELLGGLGIGIAFVPAFYDSERMPGIVSKSLVNADGSPFAEVEINQVVAYKKDKLSPMIQTLIGQVNGL